MEDMPEQQAGAATSSSQQRPQSQPEESDQQQEIQTIIIVPGAHTLLIGRHTDGLPSASLHAIARRRKRQSASSMIPSASNHADQDTCQQQMDTDEEETQRRVTRGKRDSGNRSSFGPRHRSSQPGHTASVDVQCEDAVLFDREIDLGGVAEEAEVAWDSRGADTGQRLEFARPQTLANFNKSVKVQSVPHRNDPHGIDALEENQDAPSSADGNPASSFDVVCGDDVKRIPVDSDYDVYFPIKFADFDLAFRRQDEPADWRPRSRSKQQIKTDLATIWTSAIEKHLDMSRHDIKDCQAVIVVPDTSSHALMRNFMDVALDLMGFKAAFVHHESVCACFGAGVASACVVNIGHSCTSVACVDDGMAMPRTRIVQPYGGANMDAALLKAMTDVGFSFPELNVTRLSDMASLWAFKEKHVHANLSGATQAEVYEFELRRPGEACLKRQVRLDAQLAYPVLSLFDTSALAVIDSDSEFVALGAPGDVEPDEIFLMETQNDDPVGPLARGPIRTGGAAGTNATSLKQLDRDVAIQEDEDRREAVQRARSEAEAAEREKQARQAAAEAEEDANGAGDDDRDAAETPKNDVDDDDDHDEDKGENEDGDSSGKPAVKRAKTKKKSARALAAQAKKRKEEELAQQLLSMPGLVTFQTIMPLDEAVTHSIMQVLDNATKRKLYLTVLLVGGPARTPGLGKYLKIHLHRRLPAYLRPVVDAIAVLERPRDMDPGYISWKGGAVVAALKSIQECWITRQEWLDGDQMMLVRERLPFIW